MAKKGGGMPPQMGQSPSGGGWTQTVPTQSLAGQQQMPDMPAGQQQAGQNPFAQQAAPEGQAQTPPPEYLAAQQAQQAMLASPQGQAYQQAQSAAAPSNAYGQQSPSVYGLPSGGAGAGQFAAMQGMNAPAQRPGKGGAMPPQYGQPPPQFTQQGQAMNMANAMRNPNCP